MKELTPEQREAGMLLLKRAAQIATRHGFEILEDSDGNPREAIAAACIILSTLGLSNDMTMHDIIGIFMEIHKHTIHLSKEKMQ